MQEASIGDDAFRNSGDKAGTVLDKVVDYQADIGNSVAGSVGEAVEDVREFLGNTADSAREKLKAAEGSLKKNCGKSKE